MYKQQNLKYSDESQQQHLILVEDLAEISVFMAGQSSHRQKSMQKVAIDLG